MGGCFLVSQLIVCLLSPLLTSDQRLYHRSGKRWHSRPDLDVFHYLDGIHPSQHLHGRNGLDVSKFFTVYSVAAGRILTMMDLSGRLLAVASTTGYQSSHQGSIRNS